MEYCDSTNPKQKQATKLQFVFFFQISVTHYFSIDKARVHLDYNPVYDPDLQWEIILASYGINGAGTTEHKRKQQQQQSKVAGLNNNNSFSNTMLSLVVSVFILCLAPSILN